jgi:biotin carboxyl carrier protein
MLELEVGGRARRVDVRGGEVLLDSQRVHVDAARLGEVVSLVIGGADASARDSRCGRSYEIAVTQHGSGELLVYVNGRPIVVSLSPADTARARITARRPGGRSERLPSGPHRVVAPMSGRIAKVLVKVGDQVTARQGLVVVEAMKMENELRSPRDGTVLEVRALEGALVESNALLVIVG